MIDRSPVLAKRTIAPRSFRHRHAGLEALVYLAADIAPQTAGAKPAWRCSNKRPSQSEVEFAIIAPVRRLIILAAEMPA